MVCGLRRYAAPAGLDVDQLREIGDYATSPVYTDDERAAIAYADAMTAARSEVTDEQLATWSGGSGAQGWSS